MPVPGDAQSVRVAAYSRASSVVSDWVSGSRRVPGQREPKSQNTFTRTGILRVPPISDRPTYRAVKRTFDLVIGGALLVLSAPLLALLVLAVRLDSAGPVFYRQRRVGEGGREFDMWKLRSMFEDADRRVHEVAHLDVHGNGFHFKIPHDPRVTRVGGILRRFSLDELPQLWNVVRGDMSLVGPRPPLPEEVARYSRRQIVRLRVPGGLTGLWQVSGRSKLKFDECIRLDRLYVARRSLWLDLVIVIKTVGVVLGGDGAF